MKFLKVLISLIVLSGCQKLLYHEIIIENSTDYQILIEAFANGVESESILIEPKNNYTYSEFRERKDGFPYLFESSMIDSVNIIFNNEKISKQFCDSSLLVFCLDVNRNILLMNREYKEYKTDKNSYFYVYTISEEDYNNAEPIEK